MPMTKRELKDQTFEFNSQSRKGVTYKVTLVPSPFEENKGKLMLYCTCPSWKFKSDKNGNRTCKHIEELLKQLHPSTVRQLVQGEHGGLNKF